MDSINDIEPIVENSFGYIFYILYGAIFLITIIFVIWLLKRTNKKKKNPYSLLDFTAPNKELLYQFTIIAKEEGINKELEELLKELEAYKYSKDAKEVDSYIIEKIKNYIRSVERGDI